MDTVEDIEDAFNNIMNTVVTCFCFTIFVELLKHLMKSFTRFMQLLNPKHVLLELTQVLLIHMKHSSHSFCASDCHYRRPGCLFSSKRKLFYINKLNIYLL